VREDHRRVFWGQGTFVTPQHFRLSEAATDASRHFLWRLVRPHGWGVALLELDHSALQRGHAEVACFEGVLADGELLVGGRNRPFGNLTVPPRSLATIRPSGSGVVSLYLARAKSLALAKQTTAEPPAFTGSGPLPPRYWTYLQEVADDQQPEEPQASLSVIKTVLSLVTDHDDGFANVSQGAELLKIAELISPRPQSFVVDTDYFPPMLHFGAHSALRARVSQLCDALQSRYSAMLAARKPLGVGDQSITAADAARMMVLQTLARQVPVLADALNSDTLHPHELYLRLRQMVADFSAFCEGFDALGMGKPYPDYEHSDLRSCLPPLFDILAHAIESLSPSPTLGIRLVHDGKHYVADIPAAVAAAAGTRYFLLVQGEYTAAHLVEQLTSIGKVGSKDVMDALATAKAPGVRVEVPDHLPPELPRPSRHLNVFELRTEGPLWSRVLQSRKLAIDTPLSPSGVSFTLYPLARANG
jgi:type VI secretion system protein ImpJ